MTDPGNEKNKSNNGAENEKMALDSSECVQVGDSLDESKAHLINANGGADHQVMIVDGTDKTSDHTSFNGLGKDEVMQYANDPFWVRLRWVLFILFWIGWFAMLVTAIIIIVIAPRCPPRPDMKWYQKETVYQVYSKSFKDSDKDGFGDFKGLKDKFDYITDDLGIKAVYLNSILKVDDGKEIDEYERDLAILDHKSLDLKFGATVEKFKSWIKDLRKKDQHVIMDFIPNQTSKKHEWFMKSAKGEADYKDYYIWAPGSGTGNKSSSPPNDWKDINGNSAWEYDDDRKEYYYHSHSKYLPDLNLRSEAVKEEIKEIMKFWLSAGIGGFNIQDLEYLTENKDLSVSDDADHSHTRNYNDTQTFLKELRDVANSYSDKPGRERFLFGSVKHGTENQTMSYYGKEKEKALHIVIPQMSKILKPDCKASCLSTWIGNLSDDREKWVGLQLGNQDGKRLADIFDKDTSMNVKRLQAIQMLLPGTPFTYYGDEFGQKGSSKSDPLDTRRPMQWTGEKGAGFTEADKGPWNKLGSNYKTNNLRISRSHFNEHTILGAMQKLIELREKESFQWGKTKACAINEVLLFTRKAERFPFFMTLINAGDVAQSPHLPSVKCVESKEKATVVFHSRDEGVGDILDLKHAVKLEAGDIVVLEFTADD